MTAAEHPTVPEDLMAYADGELPSDRAAFVARHLTKCAECRQVIADLRKVSDDLERWTPAPPSSLRAPHKPPATNPVSRRRRFMAWLPAASAQYAMAAACVVVVLFGTVWFDTWKRAAISADLPQRASRSASPNNMPIRVGGGAGGAVASAQEVPQSSAAAFGRAAAAPVEQAATAPSQAPRTARIIRSITLAIVAKDFADVRPAVDRILRDVSGFVGQIQVSGTEDEARWLRATLRVPAARVDEAVQNLRTLGTVVDENQSGEDVTEQIVDLEARLANSRNTERRLVEVLKNRTGKVTEVLEVEREMARVRSEIEVMEARRTTIEQRVTYATITLDVREQRRATLGGARPPLAARMRDATVEGVRGAYDSVVAAALATLRLAPPLLLWVAILWVPVRRAIRAVRSVSPPSATRS